MRSVILVPRREGFPDRDALWRFCRPWWGGVLPDLTIYEGHHELGLFNRSAALNRASAMAGEWDVALVIDSDVVCDPARVREALRLAAETGNMVLPFDVRRDLNGRGTAKVIEGYQGSWKPYIWRSWKDQHSSVVAIPRRLWDAVGGFDEGFSGWGMEDTAFAIACEVIGGVRAIHLPGELWHLFHAPAPEGHKGPATLRNRARGERYKAAWTDPDAIRALVAEGKTIAADRTDGRIPRIIHRTVPAETSPEVEGYWRKWTELHPGWRMLTHRDPLPPEEWPVTSPMWPKVKAGAQLADLIRLEALHRWGGFYVDSDMEPFRSLEPLTGVTVVAAWEDSRCIPNAFLGAVPDSPVIARCIELAMKRIPKGDIWHAGPGVTTEVLRADPEALLLPPESVYPVHYRDPERETLMASFAPKEHPATLMLHHYAGSWLRKRDANG